MFTKEDAIAAIAICAGAYALLWIIVAILVWVGLV